MRPYGKIFTTFWTSPDIRQRTDDGRLFALYLLSGPHHTMLGAFRLPLEYIAADLSWARSRVDCVIGELSESSFLLYDAAVEWVMVRRFLHWNAPENANQVKALLKLLDQVPKSSPILAHLVDAIGPCLRKFRLENALPRVSATNPQPSRNPFETVPCIPFEQLHDGLPNQEQEQEQQEQDLSEALSIQLDEAPENLDEMVQQVFSTHPANEKLVEHGRSCPADQERAIAEAVVHDGFDLVMAGTKNLRDAFAERDDKQFIPNPVSFYRPDNPKNYLADPAIWTREKRFTFDSKAEQRKQRNREVIQSLANDLYGGGSDHKPVRPLAKAAKFTF